MHSFALIGVVVGGWWFVYCFVYKLEIGLDGIVVLMVVVFLRVDFN